MPLKPLSLPDFLARQRPVRRDVVTVYERTGGNACGAHLVELACGHTTVVEAVSQVRETRDCPGCKSAAAMRDLLEEYHRARLRRGRNPALSAS